MVERTFTAYLTADQARSVTKMAEKQGRTTDEVLAEAIGHGLEQMNQKPAKPTGKRRPKVDPDKVHPAGIVDLGNVGHDRDGYAHATLLLPGVPPSQVEAIGHACAVTILHVLNWPDDKAAAMAERVRTHLAKELHMAMAPGLEPLPVTKDFERDMDDGIPF